MGAWGGGHYQSDFALDLKATIKGLMRAPITDDELVAELEATIGSVVDGADSLNFWLVVADQFERSGMRRQGVVDRATGIIEAREDVAMLEDLGADSRTVLQRRNDNAKLLERLRNPRPVKARTVVKKPQPLLLHRGEALTWPTDKGASINAYVPEDELWKVGGFTQDGWGIGVVTDAGHMFHVLAYYAVQVFKWRRPEQPQPRLVLHCPRSRHHYGVTSELNLKRARVERLGVLPEDAIGEALDAKYAARMARNAVINGVGLTGVFGYDAWNHWVIPGPKFLVPAVSGTEIDPDEPDQRPEPV